MLTVTVISTVPFQYAGFIGSQIGKQARLTRLLDLVVCNVSFNQPP